MCFGGPVCGGWGMPWLMFLVPLLMLAFMFLAFRLFRPRFAHWCGYHHPTDRIWAEEARSMRKEIEELRNQLKNGRDPDVKNSPA